MKNVFVSRLRELLAGRTVAEFARIVGLPQQTVDRYLKEERTPNGESLVQLCVKLGVSADWLLGIDSASHDPPAVGAVGEAKLYDGGKPCAACAVKDAALADLSASVRDLSAALARKS